MKKNLTLILIILVSFLKSQSIGDFVGESKFQIQKLKDNPSYENVLTGDFFKLAFIVKDSESLIKSLLFEFDKKDPSENTICQAVYIFIPKEKLEYARIKMKSDFPLYNEEYDIYHNGKIGAKILESSNDNLIKILYFDYKKSITEK